MKNRRPVPSVRSRPLRVLLVNTRVTPASAFSRPIRRRSTHSTEAAEVSLRSSRQWPCRRPAPSRPSHRSYPPRNCRPFRQPFRLRCHSLTRPMSASTDRFTTPTITPRPPVKCGPVRRTDVIRLAADRSTSRLIIRIRIRSRMRLFTVERSKILSIIRRDKNKKKKQSGGINQTKLQVYHSLIVLLVLFCLCEYAF